MCLVCVPVCFNGLRPVICQGDVIGRNRQVCHDRKGRGKVGCGFLEQLYQPSEVHVTVSKEHGIVGTVELSGELQGICCFVGAQLVGVAQYLMPQGMLLEHQVLEVVVDKFCGRVVVYFYFVANHLYFLVEFRLRISAVEHDVGE